MRLVLRYDYFAGKDAAFADFERIIEFALQSTPDSGSRTLERIRSAIEILEAHPLIGRRVDGQLRELVMSEGATGSIALIASILPSG